MRDVSRATRAQQRAAAPTCEAQSAVEPERRAAGGWEVIHQELAATNLELPHRKVHGLGTRWLLSRAETVEVGGAVGADDEMQRRLVEHEPAHFDTTG